LLTYPVRLSTNGVPIPMGVSAYSRLLGGSGGGLQSQELKSGHTRIRSLYATDRITPRPPSPWHSPYLPRGCLGGDRHRIADCRIHRFTFLRNQTKSSPQSATLLRALRQSALSLYRFCQQLFTLRYA